MRKVISVVVSFLLVILTGCASKVTETKYDVEIPKDSQETLIYSSADKRPDWTLTEPDTVDGVMTFVGLSDRHSTEKASREDARRNATGAVVKYMGTLVKDKWERAATSFGLEGDVIDPTAATNDFQKQLAVQVAKKVKVKTWYIEKWQTPTGAGYQIYALAHVPEATVDESYKETANTLAKAAERKAKEAGDELAKQQAEKAAEFWKQMEERGATD